MRLRRLQRRDDAQEPVRFLATPAARGSGSGHCGALGPQPCQALLGRAASLWKHIGMIASLGHFDFMQFRAGAISTLWSVASTWFERHGVARLHGG
jgi:hypothetical protein